MGRLWRKEQGAGTRHDTIELKLYDSPTEQMSNIRPAIAKGANAIVMGPVGSPAHAPPLQRAGTRNPSPKRKFPHYKGVRGVMP